jgi:hypothetical protein
MNKKIFLNLSLAIYLVLISGLTHSAENDSKSTGMAKLLNGRTYIRLDNNATCKSNNPEHTVLKTWANKITFENGRVLIWGKVCNDSPESLPVTKIGKNLLISADLKRIVYNKEVLLYFNADPKLCDAGQWCPVENSTP